MLLLLVADGIEVYNHTKFVDAGGSFIFDIEKIPCVLNVVDETSHFTYHLTVSGLTIEPLDESKDATSQEQNLKESTVGGAHKLVPYESSSKSASEVVAYDQLTDEPSISR